MNKGKEINMNINIKKTNNEVLLKIGKCILNADIINASKEKQIPSDFDCSIDNIENPEKIESIELVSSDEITGIPSDPLMINPMEVDKLIASGNLSDFTLNENKNIIPPIFKTSSLISLGCKSTGEFKLKGKFDQNIKHFRFNLPLSYPAIDTRCNVPEANAGEEVELTCKTKSKFSNSKIIIEQSTFSKNYSEVISLLPISSDNEISCDDFVNVNNKKMEKNIKHHIHLDKHKNLKIIKEILSFHYLHIKLKIMKTKKK